MTFRDSRPSENLHTPPDPLYWLSVPGEPKTGALKTRQTIAVAIGISDSRPRGVEVKLNMSIKDIPLTNEKGANNLCPADLFCMWAAAPFSSTLQPFDSISIMYSRVNSL